VYNDRSRREGCWGSPVLFRRYIIEKNVNSRRRILEEIIKEVNNAEVTTRSAINQFFSDRNRGHRDKKAY
jgi:transcription elongation factor GreA-like protein